MNPIANRFGEIILCQFPFTSGDGNKVRPSLVLFDFWQDAIICRVTSVFYTEPLDIPVTDWQRAGLLKPSVVRLGRIVTAEKSIFIRRLGVLSSVDLETVRIIWNQHMRL